MITYPVDVDNTLWAAYSLSAEGVTERNKKWRVSDGSERPGLDEDIVMLKHVDGDKPIIDEATEKLVKQDDIIDLDANEIKTPWNKISLSVDEVATKSRSAGRKAMRDDWDALEYDYIRGPYDSDFEAANLLLNKGKDGAAKELLDALEPTAKIAADATMTAVFNSVKSGFVTALENLTKIE